MKGWHVSANLVSRNIEKPYFLLSRFGLKNNNSRSTAKKKVLANSCELFKVPVDLK